MIFNILYVCVCLFVVSFHVVCLTSSPLVKSDNRHPWINLPFNSIRSEDLYNKTMRVSACVYLAIPCFISITSIVLSFSLSLSLLLSECEYYLFTRSYFFRYHFVHIVFLFSHLFYAHTHFSRLHLYFNISFHISTLTNMDGDEEGLNHLVYYHSHTHSHSHIIIHINQCRI